MRILAGLAVMLAWIGLWGRATTAIVLSGLVFGLAAVVRTTPSGSVTVRPLATIRAIGHVVVLLGKANVTVVAEVLREVIGRRQPFPEGIVDVRLAAPHGLDVLIATVVTMTPGTAVLDLDREPGGTVLRVHTIRLESAEALRAEVAHLDELAIAAFVRGNPEEVAT